LTTAIIVDIVIVHCFVVSGAAAPRQPTRTDATSDDGPTFWRERLPS
jgi:hypothetical protein